MAVHRLDAALLSQPESTPVSAVCAHLAEPQEGRVTARFAVAGHPLPLLLRAGKLREIGRGGTLAGAATRGDWPESVVEFRPGDTVVFYTDGVTEARNEAGLFGGERLAACVRSGSPDPRELVARLKSELTGFQPPSTRDDTTLLAMRFDGASEQTLSDGATSAPRRRRLLRRLRGGARARA
jgi:hypothetical protein